MSFWKQTLPWLLWPVFVFVTHVPAQTVPSITRGYPTGSFGNGEQTSEVTEPEQWRWAELYYGFIDIDAIKQSKDAC